MDDYPDIPQVRIRSQEEIEAERYTKTDLAIDVMLNARIGESDLVERPRGLAWLRWPLDTYRGWRLGRALDDDADPQLDTPPPTEEERVRVMEAALSAMHPDATPAEDFLSFLPHEIAEAVVAIFRAGGTADDAAAYVRDNYYRISLN